MYAEAGKATYLEISENTVSRWRSSFYPVHADPPRSGLLEVNCSAVLTMAESCSVGRVSVRPLASSNIAF